MRLYSYWRSSSAYRVRIALNLKGVDYEIHPVDLLKGEQRSEAHLARNPEGKVPALELGDGTILTQSLAIIDWLEAQYPDPQLIPTEPLQRCRVLAAAHAIAMSVQPICNSGIVAYLARAHAFDQDATRNWMQHWMTKGLRAFEQLVDRDGTFCFGEAPGLADICLIPQLYNARRWGMKIADYPQLAEIEATCMAIEAFAKALPENQPDATL